MEEVTGYELSRQWFDFCFENPDMISPTHTALYFFAIEHCNRMGWKEKFGLPTQMAMDAIGIRNWRTYSKAFNDIVSWGFFRLVTKSKNQYSATVIAIVKNTKAHTKALSKAMQKHLQKQVSSIAVINKPYNHITREPNNIHTWRENFDQYVKEIWSEFEKAKEDKIWISNQERLNPGVDIILSIEKSISNFWATEAGWKNKKGRKTENPNWIQTFARTLDKNKVYKQNGTHQQFTARTSQTRREIEDAARDLSERLSNS